MADMKLQINVTGQRKAWFPFATNDPKGGRRSAELEDGDNVHQTEENVGRRGIKGMNERQSSKSLNGATGSLRRQMPQFVNRKFITAGLNPHVVVCEEDDARSEYAYQSAHSMSFEN